MSRDFYNEYFVNRVLLNLTPKIIALTTFVDKEVLENFEENNGELTEDEIKQIKHLFAEQHLTKAILHLQHMTDLTVTANQATQLTNYLLSNSTLSTTIRMGFCEDCNEE